MLKSIVTQIFTAMLIIVLGVSFIYPDTPSKGDKIQQMKDAAEQKKKDKEEADKAKKEAENKKEPVLSDTDGEESTGLSDEGEDSEDNTSENNTESFASFFAQIFIFAVSYSFTYRYADYPYADPGNFNFNRSFADQKTNRRNYQIAFANITADYTYMFDSIHSIGTKVSINLLALNLNCVYQEIYSPNDYFSTLTANAGLTLLNFENLMLDGFLGVFWQSFHKKNLLSGGFALKVFFNRKIYFDYYGVFSYDGEYDMGFSMHTASLNYSLKMFSIGLGLNYNNYVGVEYVGPSLKLSFWL